MFSEIQNIFKNIFENIFIKNTSTVETYQKMNVELLLVVSADQFEVWNLKITFHHFGCGNLSFWREFARNRQKMLKEFVFGGRLRKDEGKNRKIPHWKSQSTHIP